MTTGGTPPDPLTEDATEEADELPLVFVVNSDPAFLEMVGDLLAGTRARVRAEQLNPHIETTLENLRAARPRLLIFDVVPYHLETCQAFLDRLAADLELKELPVMLASTTPDIAERVAQSHADLVRDVLPKPFDLDDFYAKLNKLVVGTIAP